VLPLAALVLELVALLFLHALPFDGVARLVAAPRDAAERYYGSRLWLRRTPQ